MGFFLTKLGVHRPSAQNINQPRFDPRLTPGPTVGQRPGIRAVHNGRSKKILLKMDSPTFISNPAYNKSGQQCFGDTANECPGRVGHGATGQWPSHKAMHCRRRPCLLLNPRTRKFATTIHLLPGTLHTPTKGWGGGRKNVLTAIMGMVKGNPFVGT